jgi:predicted transcriptional regulator
MKISQKSYDYLKKEIEIVKQEKQENINSFHKLHYNNTRIMWDILHYINSKNHGETFRMLYAENLNDSHIQTAIFKIGKELNIIE